MRRHIAIAALFAAVLLSVPKAHADVVYAFSSPGVPAVSIPAFSWSFIQPSLITSTTTVAAADLSSLNNPAGCTVSSATISNPQMASFSVSTGFVPNCGGFGVLGFTFSDGPINHFGTYSDDDLGTLVVSQVPEPSSLMLLGTGALGLLGPIRRRLLPRWK